MEKQKLVVDVDFINLIINRLGKYPFEEVNGTIVEIQKVAQEGLKEYQELTTPKTEEKKK